jgi:hypothetical protein
VQPGTGSGKIHPSAGRTHDAPGYLEKTDISPVIITPAIKYE